jgi:hypothetical protein
MSGELHPYIFNPAPRDHVVIQDKLVNLRDVWYFYIAEYDNVTSALEADPNSFLLIADSDVGSVEIGNAYSEEAALKALDFVKRA